ncbi:MAG: TetR/AcrR family transcriptional regulator [Pseudomonadota bacterium]
MEQHDQKQKLMEVGIELIAAKGYSGTSIRDIAAAHGTSISNIYHYFGSKDGLLAAILQHLSQKLVDGLRLAHQEPDEPLAGLKKMVDAHLALSEENRNGAKIFLLDAEHFSPESNRLSRGIQVEILALYVDQLKRVQEAGLIGDRDLKIIAFNILACINWQLRWFRPGGSLSAEEIRREIWSFILGGVLGMSEPAR